MSFRLKRVGRRERKVKVRRRGDWNVRERGRGGLEVAKKRGSIVVRNIGFAAGGR